MLFAMAVAYPPLSPRTRRRLRAATTVVVLAVATVAVLARPDGSGPGTHTGAVAATVNSVTRARCTDAAPEIELRCVTITVRANGRDLTLPETAEEPSVHVGDAVFIDPATPRVVGHRPVHVPGLLVLAAVALVVVAWWRGLGALGAIGVLVLLARFYVMPAIEDGRSVAVVGAAGGWMAIVALAVLLHGVDARSAVAVISATLAIAVGAAVVGVAGGDALLGAGALLAASAGALHVAVRQVEATWDVSTERGYTAVVIGGLRRGRRALAETSTIVAAVLAGIAVPLLATSPSDTDLVRGAIALLVLASVVPITTVLAASVVIAER